MATKSESLDQIKTKSITLKEAKASADQQIWQRTFRPDYDQVMLRISTAPLNSLRYGQPPPSVT